MRSTASLPLLMSDTVSMQLAVKQCENELAALGHFSPFVREVRQLVFDPTVGFRSLEAVAEPFTAAATDAALHALGERTGRQMGDLVHPVRVAVSGTGVGPGLFDMLATLGKERVLARIRRPRGLHGGQG